MASLGLLVALAAIAPTLEDVDYARMASVPGNFSHCAPIKDLRCAQRKDYAKRFDCAYRESVNEGVSPEKKITVENVGGNWTKMSGDAPSCTVVYLEIVDQGKVENHGSNQ